ncbi:MAG TPA: hypothetical protein VK994_05940, partial [Bacteroidales bacterium]|nr:hypothetical protein [Bacteroidales bacterium]
LRAIHTSLQEYDVKDYTYDLIVSNPPFFVNSLLPPGHSKSMAKHTTTLSFTELFAACRLLTKPAGNFCIIGPHDSLLRMRRHAALNGLCLSRKLEIIPVIGKKANRVLTEWSFTQHTEATDKLPIRTPDGQYTDAYRQLTCDFYLAL